VSALPSALALALVTASFLAPPALPPEPTGDRAQPGPDDAGDPPAQQGQPAPPGPPPEPAPPVDDASPPRSSLPPGLEPVPFPLEQQRQTQPPPTLDGEPDQQAPPPEPPRRRSIVDLRDPFERPPPLPRSGEREANASRLLMPDLKDPFAPGVRRVRSKKLDMYVPNDIRDPFRTRARADGPRPPCAVTTEDGTVVQKPGKDELELPNCRQGPLDLRDPFSRGGNGGG
jgi:hypothetical protein